MSLNISRSQNLFAAAQNLFPGGVNSPVRAFRAVGGAQTLYGIKPEMTAGIETLSELQMPDIWKSLESRAAQLSEGLDATVKKAHAAVTTQRVGTMFTSFFTDHSITNWATAKTADTHKFGRFFRALLEKGVYIAPSQFEANFVSTAHTSTVI